MWGGGHGEGPALDEGPLGLGRRECPRWKVRPPGFTETTVRIELFDPVGVGCEGDQGLPLP